MKYAVLENNGISPTGSEKNDINPPMSHNTILNAFCNNKFITTMQTKFTSLNKAPKEVLTGSLTHSLTHSLTTHSFTSHSHTHSLTTHSLVVDFPNLEIW